MGYPPLLIWLLLQAASELWAGMQRLKASTADVMGLLGEVSEPLKNRLAAHLQHLEAGGTTASFLQQQQAGTSSAGADAVKDVAGPADRSGAMQLQRKSSSGVDGKSLFDIRGRLEQLKSNNKGGGVLAQSAAPPAVRETIMAESGVTTSSSEVIAANGLCASAASVQQIAAADIAAAAPAPLVAGMGGFGCTAAPGSIAAAAAEGLEGMGRQASAAAGVIPQGAAVADGLASLRARIKAVQQ